MIVLFTMTLTFHPNAKIYTPYKICTITIGKKVAVT